MKLRALKVLLMLPVLFPVEVNAGGNDTAPVAKWSFENDVKDSSGNSNDGIVMGDAKYVEGVMGKAFRFDGNTCVKIPYSPSFSQTSAITVSLFVKFQKVSGRTFLVDKAHPGNAYLLRLADSDGLPVFRFQRGLGGSAAGSKSENWAVVTSETPVQIGKWYHLAAVDDGALLRVYIDGELCRSAAVTNTPLKHTKTSLCIGGLSDDRAFSGDMDEIMIFNRALTKDEIRALAGILKKPGE
jgi:hypothetical protein